LKLFYGLNGETPVFDADLTSHLENNMYELAYYTIPFNNTSTYASPDEDQTSEMWIWYRMPWIRPMPTLLP